MKNVNNEILLVENSVVDNTKNKITEEKVAEILDTLYVKAINGIPKVSLPVQDLVNDYMCKNPSVDKAAKSLINNSTVKCATSGFLSGLGGFTSMIITLPANVTSVLYVQLRMCVAVAAMAGYDIHSDQVQTLVYACLTGSAAADILKQAGIQFGNKLGIAMVKKIPGKTLTAINQKVGFRFLTKFGEKGIVNLGKVVPVIGGVIGGGTDIASTRIIGNNAYKLFIKNEVPTSETKDEKRIFDAEFVEVNDIDCKTLQTALNEKNDVMLDPYEEVKKLKELLDMEILTKEEFDKKKKELLNL